MEQEESSELMTKTVTTARVILRVIISMAACRQCTDDIPLQLGLANPLPFL